MPDNSVNAVGHKLFWASWHMPKEEDETDNDMQEKLTAVQKLLAQNLAERMIADGSISMQLSIETDDNEEPIYKFVAKACITNPDLVVSDDIKAFNRLHDYADHFPFKSEEDHDVFYDVLEQLKPNSITLN